MNITKRNHYNPCFWTAHWNPAYHDAYCRGEKPAPAAREQRVHALSVKSGELFQSNVDGVHFDKNMAFAEITREAADDFAKRHFPGEYDDFARKNVDAEYPVFLDFEEILGALERLPSYQVLLDVICARDIRSPNDKAWLSSFFFLHHLRSHAILNAMIEWHGRSGRHKFEHFLILRWLLADIDFLNSATVPLAYCPWTLYIAHTPTFPLCDSPILVSPTSVMVALSPFLLVEALPPVPGGEHHWRLDDAIPDTKFQDFRRRTIANTFREIIGPEQVLRDWKGSIEFKDRVALLRSERSYIAAMGERAHELYWPIRWLG